MALQKHQVPNISHWSSVTLWGSSRKKITFLELRSHRNFQAFSGKGGSWEEASGIRPQYKGESWNTGKAEGPGHGMLRQKEGARAGQDVVVKTCTRFLGEQTSQGPETSDSPAAMQIEHVLCSQGLLAGGLGDSRFPSFQRIWHPTLAGSSHALPTTHFALGSPSLWGLLQCFWVVSRCSEGTCHAQLPLVLYIY